MTPNHRKKSAVETLERETYDELLYQLRVELVKLQRHVIDRDLKVLVIFEGRDAAGKDGAIKRMIRHMSPRDTRVFAPGKPSDREAGSWYFQRFTPHLPASGEIVLFNRSWYNRAGVERVMEFCSAEEGRRFLSQAPVYEKLLVEAGVILVKLYLDISREVQVERLEARRRDPLKQWKISPIDERAVELWEPYTRARDEMLQWTHTEHAPWAIVRGDDKRHARLNCIRWLLARIEYPGRNPRLAEPDPEWIFTYESNVHEDGRLSS